MTQRIVLYNGRVYTQADGIVADSLAVNRSRIVAVGRGLDHDPDFRSYGRLDLRGKTVVPGLVDAHTHFHYFALSLGRVRLDGLTSLDSCRRRIKKFASGLKKTEWVVGEGYSPDRFTKRREPHRRDLDSVTARRPAFMYSKDQHSCWVNSRALALAGIDRSTADPRGGKIERDSDGEPSGILREGPAIGMVLDKIPPVSNQETDRRYRLALDYAYRRGVTGVHSFDGAAGYRFYQRIGGTSRLGIRITYYPPQAFLPELHDNKVYYGSGDEYFRIAGVKVFADGSLGSQTAYCFNRYPASTDVGIEVTTVPEMKRIMKSASKLGLPCAIHAIGDRAVANVLDAFESAPAVHFGARHRIEHVQLIRRKDIPRMKRLSIVASMQPSHCPSDIALVRRYWGKRGSNAYVFRSLLDRGVDMAFGSDAPIEPLEPLAGIAAAVRRARPGSRDVFYPEQRLTALEALYAYTVGPAVAAGQAHQRGYLLPGYPADLVILDRDIGKTSPGRLYDVTVLTTMIDGKLRYDNSGLRL